MYTSGDVGQRVKVHANTIRTWSDRFKDHLSSGAISGSRIYTDQDLRVIATIAHYRQLGMSLADIGDLLDDGKLIDDLPPEPDPNEQKARNSIQLVPQDRVNRALDEIKRLSEDRDRLLIERDNAIAQLDQERHEWLESRDQVVSDLNAQIRGLEREIGLLRGQMEDRQPAAYWLTRIAVAVLLTVAAVAVIAGVILLVSARA